MDRSFRPVRTVLDYSGDRQMESLAQRLIGLGLTQWQVNRRPNEITADSFTNDGQVANCGSVVFVMPLVYSGSHVQHPLEGRETGHCSWLLGQPVSYPEEVHRRRGRKVLQVRFGKTSVARASHPQ